MHEGLHKTYPDKNSGFEVASRRVNLTLKVVEVSTLNIDLLILDCLELKCLNNFQ